MHTNSPEEKKEVLQSAEEIKSLCTATPHSMDIGYRAFLRATANLPPYKDEDRHIDESILDFTRDKGGYDPIVFYTSDKEDFDHKEIRDELVEHGIEVYFDSRKCLRRIKEELERR